MEEKEFMSASNSQATAHHFVGIQGRNSGLQGPQADTVVGRFVLIDSLCLLSYTAQACLVGADVTREDYGFFNHKSRQLPTCMATGQSSGGNSSTELPFPKLTLICV